MSSFDKLKEYLLLKVYKKATVLTNKVIALIIIMKVPQ